MTVNNTALIIQYVYGPLPAQTLAGTVKGYVRMGTPEVASAMQVRMGIRVFSGDGNTLRGTSLALTAGGTALTDDGVLRSREAPNNGPLSLTSVGVTSGDYLVIEYGAINTVSGGGNCEMRVGDNSGSDLPENETTTTDNNPWIEFSTLVDTFGTKSRSYILG